jgi:acetolactate synthase-1/2/3 large subunit
MATDVAPMPVRRTTYPAARPETIERAAALIREAKKPLVLAGNGVIRRQASETLRDFAHSLGIPVTTTFMGKGVLDYRDPLALPAMGLRSGTTPLGPLADCDLLITVGFDIVEWEPELWSARTVAPIIHVDSVAAEIDTDYRPVVEVIGEIGDSLRSLSASVGPREATDDFARYREPALEELEQAASDDRFPISPQRFIHDLRAAMADDDVLISDVGAHKLWIATRFPAAQPNTVIIANGLAGMGIALPGAIGAKLAKPGQRVVAVSGDGSFLINVQELETARRLGLPLVAVVLVDNQYGVIAQYQRRRFEETFGIDFGNPDFELLGRAFGIPARAIGSAGELLPALRQALEGDGPSLVAVPFDNSQPVKAVF